MTEGTLVQAFYGHAAAVNTIAFNWDGSLLASGSSDNTVRLWNTTTGQLLNTLAGHTGYAESLAFSPDGRRLVSSGEDSSVRLWGTGP